MLSVLLVLGVIACVAVAALWPGLVQGDFGVRQWQRRRELLRDLVNGADQPGEDTGATATNVRVIDAGTDRNAPASPGEVPARPTSSSPSGPSTEAAGRPTRARRSPAYQDRPRRRSRLTTRRGSGAPRRPAGR